MPQNEIKIKATLDESQFEREAEQMARTMDKMYERSYASANNIRQQQLLNQNLGNIGLPQSGSSAGANFQSATQTGAKRFSEEVQKHVAVMEKQRDQIKKHAEAIEKLESEQKKFNKTSTEALEIEKRITNEKVKQMGLEKDLLQRQTTLNEAFKKRELGEQGTGGKMLNSFANGGVQSAAKTGLEAVGGSGALLALGAAGATAYAIRQITNVADSIIREFASVNRVTQTASGNAVSGSAGNYLSQVYSGRSVFETGNAGERSRAFKIAMDEEGSLGTKETIRAGDTSGLGVMGNNPFSLGAGVGLGALMSIGGDDLQKARFYGRFNQGQMGKYNALRAERLVRNYQENFESAKNQDPMKQLALGHYEQTHNRDLGIQRRLGLSDNMYYGSSGFMRKYQGQFTDEQGISAMNNIMSAGGSTRMGRDPSTALRFSRNFDLTNADSVLGKLSGNIGDAGKSKSALIEVLSEGTRLGLNKSEFREEQRKFTEAAANFLAKGYGSNDEDMERMMRVFGGGVNAKTGVGIASASSSADIVSGVSSQGTGPEGALGFAALLSGKYGKRLSAQSQQALNTMDLKDLSVDNPRIAGMAMEAQRPGDKKAVTPQDIISEKMQSIKDKLFRDKNMQNLTTNVVRMKDIKFPGKSNKEIVALANAGDPDAKKIVAQLHIAQDYVGSAYGISNDQNKVDSLTDDLGHFGDPGYNISDDSRAIINKKFNGGSVRTADKVNEGIGHDQSIVTDKTASMLSDFSSMAETSKQMSASMVDAMLKIQQLATSLQGLSASEVTTELGKRGKTLEDIFGAAATRPATPANQTHGGKR